jgi:TolB-like protein
MLSKIKENTNLSEYTEKQIREQLERILSNDLFSRSFVLCSFLKFIVNETLGSRTEELKEYTIAVSALGKSTDFNSQTDAIVRIHAGRLRRLLNLYYTGPGITDPIKIQLIKGSYVPVFLNHLSNKPKELKAKKVQPTYVSRSKLTLAILPFRNLCPENDYQFFVDGFGEELTRSFSTFQSIAVIAHHSTRKYASTPGDVRIIGAELGAHYIITGSVKRSSKEIKVSLDLIETMKGVQVWSQTYINTLNIENLINIQDEIIKNVCSILGGYYGLIIHETYKTHNRTISTVDSFDAALWNYYFHMNFSKETYMQTRHALEEALKYDPNNAVVLAMLSELYLDAYSLGYPTAEEPVNEAYRLAKKAIKIDPQCQHAHQQFGWANIYLKRKDEALASIEHCLSMNPSSVSTVGAVGFGMACLGEYERAYQLLSQSKALNPHCPWWFYMGFFLVFYSTKQYTKALEYANKIEATDVFLDPLTKAVSKAQLGMTTDALSDLNVLKQSYPEIMNNLNMYLNTFLLDTTLIDDIIQVVKDTTIDVA